MSLSLTSLRGGRLFCACPEDEVQPSPAAAAGTLALLAGGFGLSALSQALITGLLPLAASMIVGTGALALLPYAVLLVGMALASLIASFLIDSVGRRAGLMLGAALGTGGGLLLAVSIITYHFEGLLLASFWLGISQGFGFYYRHLASISGRFLSTGTSVGLILGAGVLAGVFGPMLAAEAEFLATPYVFVGSALLATLAHGLTILAAALLPTSHYVVDDTASPISSAVHRSILPVAVSTFAWFIMAAAMAATPMGMADCGIGLPGVFGALAWHVVAMYAPALIAGPATSRLGGRFVALSGAGFSLIGAILGLYAASEPLFLAALGFIGTGWSLAILGATVMEAEYPAKSRLGLALNDAILVIGALAGVGAAAIFS